MESYPDEVWMQFLINLSRHIDARISAGRHSAQVAAWVRATARALQFNSEELLDMHWAALLHDVGKVGVPDEVLSKAGPLTEGEWRMMRLHPTVGANIVRSLKYIAHLAPIIHAHQEHYDGSGYPEGLSGEEIPLGARILAVVDAYDAMTHDRVYRKACSPLEAREELQRYAGSHFDPGVVGAFIDIVLPPNGNKKSLAIQGRRNSPRCHPA